MQGRLRVAGTELELYTVNPATAATFAIASVMKPWAEQCFHQAALSVVESKCRLAWWSSEQVCCGRQVLAPISPCTAVLAPCYKDAVSRSEAEVQSLVMGYMTWGANLHVMSATCLMDSC